MWANGDDSYMYSSSAAAVEGLLSLESWVFCCYSCGATAAAPGHHEAVSNLVPGGGVAVGESVARKRALAHSVLVHDSPLPILLIRSISASKAIRRSYSEEINN